MSRSKKHVSLLMATLVLWMMLLVGMPTEAAYTSRVSAFVYNGYTIPAYDGDLYEEINGNKPSFTAAQLNQTIYENYGALDSLGRVTVCSANIDQTLMPTEKRGNISSVKPTGWIQKQYDFISGRALYNRSHLIAFQLTGENANRNNLMTGTRMFNQIGMTVFENRVAAYIKEDSENNVLYRVTPVFRGDNLLADGVIMEAESVDDGGAAIEFCVFIYNVETGVSIDYLTGDSVPSDAAEAKADLSDALVFLKYPKRNYTGKEITNLDRVVLGGVTLEKGFDYTVTYRDNRKVGTAEIVITGVGDYGGSVSATFIIRPKATKIRSIKPKKKGFSIKWKQQSVQITGYQIQYARNAKFTKSKKTVTIRKKAAVSRTVKKLKKGKKYYVRVRTYKIRSGRKYYSKWSAVKKVVTL